MCGAYAVIGVLALVGTWGNNIEYLNLGFLGANRQFWTDTLANPASRSITVDIFFLGLAVFVWMILEARRLGMRGVWLYFVFGMLIAISLTVPLFLINRERALAARERRFAGAVGAGDDDDLLADHRTICRFTRIVISCSIEIVEHAAGCGPYYAGAAHGWCPPDSSVYNESQTERAWSRLLVLFQKALA